MSRSRPKTLEFITQFDRLPLRQKLYDRAKDCVVSLAEFYGFEPIHTAALEDPRVFSSVLKAGIGQETPLIICKTKTGLDCLLPPPTALSIMRAYLSNKMNDLPHPLKFFLERESCFVQGAGRVITCRPEWGLVTIGEESPIAEAEIIQVVWRSMEEMGVDVSSCQIKVNATGCSECRPPFRSAFLAYFRSRAHKLCKNCKRSLKRTPTQILSCSEEQCQILSSGSPQVLDLLCEICKKHLRGLLEFLDELRIPYFLDPKFFKDRSWFNALIFDITSDTMENSIPENKEPPRKLVIAEGGLISRVGELVVGKRIDAVCVTVFPDRLEGIHLKKITPLSATKKPKVFFAQLGDLAKRKSFGVIEMLRGANIEVRTSLGRDAIKSQLKVAERVDAEIALILGQKEALDNTVIVREVGSGIQETISQEKLIEFLKKKLKKS